MKRILAAFILVTGWQMPAMAECTATVTETVSALEDSSSQLNPGDDFGTPTQLQIVPSEQSSYICGHGSYCYPSGPIVLEGCRIVPDPDPTASTDPSEPIIYMLRGN